MFSNHPYAHLVRLVVILVAICIIFLVARFIMVPESYYEKGKYRYNAVQEISAPLPIYQGNKSCADCHFEKVYARWMRSRHITVDCELCHGPGDTHISVAGGRNKFIEISDGKLACLTCHLTQVGRPKTFPQIEVRPHYERYKNVILNEKCIKCHNPHAPLEEISKWRDTQGEPL